MTFSSLFIFISLFLCTSMQPAADAHPSFWLSRTTHTRKSRISREREGSFVLSIGCFEWISRPGPSAVSLATPCRFAFPKRVMGAARSSHPNGGSFACSGDSSISPTFSSPPPPRFQSRWEIPRVSRKSTAGLPTDPSPTITCHGRGQPWPAPAGSWPTRMLQVASARPPACHPSSARVEMRFKGRGGGCRVLCWALLCSALPALPCAALLLPTLSG